MTPTKYDHKHEAPAKAKDEAPAPVEPAKPKTFPVKLLKGYVPMGEYEIVDNETAQITPLGKLEAGQVVRLPIDEAKRAINLKIAERADDF